MTAKGNDTISYAYKASLIGSAHQFELTDAGLAWRIAGRNGVWPYATITAIRLSYRPVSMQARRFRADIRNVEGGRIVIFSTSWQSAALMRPQDQIYRTFITALHGRMADSGSQAELTGGLGRKTYIAGVALIALFGLAMAGFLVRAIAVREWGGAAFLIGFVALFGWQVGGFVRRNRPRHYGFADLPTTLLP